MAECTACVIPELESRELNVDDAVIVDMTMGPVKPRSMNRAFEIPYFCACLCLPLCKRSQNRNKFMEWMANMQVREPKMMDLLNSLPDCELNSYLRVPDESKSELIQKTLMRMFWSINDEWEYDFFCDSKTLLASDNLDIVGIITPFKNVGDEIQWNQEMTICGKQYELLGVLTHEGAIIKHDGAPFLITNGQENRRLAKDLKEQLSRCDISLILYVSSEIISSNVQESTLDQTGNEIVKCYFADENGVSDTPVDVRRSDIFKMTNVFPFRYNPETYPFPKYPTKHFGNSALLVKMSDQSELTILIWKLCMKDPPGSRHFKPVLISASTICDPGCMDMGLYDIDTDKVVFIRTDGLLITGDIDGEDDIVRTDDDQIDDAIRNEEEKGSVLMIVKTNDTDQALYTVTTARRSEKGICIVGAPDVYEEMPDIVKEAENVYIRTDNNSWVKFNPEKHTEQKVYHLLLIKS